MSESPGAPPSTLYSLHRVFKKNRLIVAYENRLDFSYFTESLAVFYFSLFYFIPLKIHVVFNSINALIDLQFLTI